MFIFNWYRTEALSVLNVLSQAEQRRGKRLTGREIKKKTLAERRAPLVLENMREDSLK